MQEDVFRAAEEGGADEVRGLIGQGQDVAVDDCNGWMPPQISAELSSFLRVAGVGQADAQAAEVLVGASSAQAGAQAPSLQGGAQVHGQAR